MRPIQSIRMAGLLAGFFGLLLGATAQTADLPPQWIWYPEGDPRAETPAGSRYFRKTFTLEALPESATLEATADNHFRAFVNGQPVGEGHAWASLFSFEVGKHLKVGVNVIAIELLAAVTMLLCDSSSMNRASRPAIRCVIVVRFVR